MYDLEQEQAEVWERFRCEIDKGQAPQRIDKYLAEHMPGTSRNRIQTAADAGHVWVNGKPVSSNYKVKPMDVVQVLLDHEPHDYTIYPENIPLNVVYEDDDVLVINKPAGMVVHPGHGNYEHTLLNALAYYFQDKLDINDPNIGLVHRIDKDTSGLLLVAKNDAAQLALSEQLSTRTMEKHYRALVEGNLREDAGRIEAAIARSKKDRKKMAVDEEGREAITEWTVLSRGRGVTLLDVHILTGRTHQIRVHTRHIGHPVCGDPIYGSAKGAKVPRLMLHAYSLTFTHPRTGERMTFTAALPEEFLRGMKSHGAEA
jgi:23S rRNA pseudouridine1911/1915/1917 synthase